MLTVTINDVEVEAKVGEKLLGVARRNGAHIGFVCDGNGVCQTCQCRVLSGADLLSPPSEAERAWMPDRRLADGNRLACQAVIRGEGHVQILTTAEELRRQTLAVLRPRAGEDRRDSLEQLIEHFVRLNVDQLAKYPWNIFATIGRVGLWRFAFPILDTERYAGDGARVVRKMISGVDRVEAPHPAGNGAGSAHGSGASGASGAAGGSPRLSRTGPRVYERPRQIASPLEEQILESARALRRARESVRRFE